MSQAELDNLFGAKVVVFGEFVVVDGNLSPQDHGISARARRWKEILPLAKHDYVIADDAVDLATGWLGTERMSSESILECSRARLAIASQKFPPRTNQVVRQNER